MAERLWWVNHSHTAEWEIPGEYLWFPGTSRASKTRNEISRTIQSLSPGDVILSCAEAAIGAVGVVLEVAREAARPAELAAVDELAAAGTGWLVPVRFMALMAPLRIADHAAELGPVLPRKHAPIRPNGTCNQHVLLAPVAAPMAAPLRRMLAGEVERISETISEAMGRTFTENAAAAAIRQRTDISPGQRILLLRAREGQGLFRENLEKIERACRITGLLDRRHLRAVHIKPWPDCDDHEKVDGFNGLLMSPHVAHLFSRGYISFSDGGELLVSQELNPAVLQSWGIQVPRNVGAFAPEQGRFLDYHRRQVFEQHGGGRRQPGQTHEVEGDFAAAKGEPVVVTPA